MTVTRRAVDGIRFLSPAAGETYSANLREAADPKKLLDGWKNLGARAEGRGPMVKGKGLFMEPQWIGDRDGTDFILPAPILAEDGWVKLPDASGLGVDVDWQAIEKWRVT